MCFSKARVYSIIAEEPVEKTPGRRLCHFVTGLKQEHRVAGGT